MPAKKRPHAPRCRLPAAGRGHQPLPPRGVGSPRRAPPGPPASRRCGRPTEKLTNGRRGAKKCPPSVFAAPRRRQPDAPLSFFPTLSENTARPRSESAALCPPKSPVRRPLRLFFSPKQGRGAARSGLFHHSTGLIVETQRRTNRKMQALPQRQHPMDRRKHPMERWKHPMDRRRHPMDRCGHGTEAPKIAHRRTRATLLAFTPFLRTLSGRHPKNRPTSQSHAGRPGCAPDRPACQAQRPPLYQAARESATGSS